MNTDEEAYFAGFSVSSLFKLAFIFDSLGYDKGLNGVCRFEDDLFNGNLKSAKQRTIEYYEAKAKELRNS